MWELNERRGVVSEGPELVGGIASRKAVCSEASSFTAGHRNRWYDSSVGRWLSEDPIGFEGGDANLVRYVGNGVTNYIDPSGLISADGWVDGWGKVHADLISLSQVFRAELVDDKGLIKYSEWQNQMFGGRPAVAFADKMIQAFLDPATNNLKTGFKWRYLLAAAGDFQAKFQKAEKGEGKCAYWVQFVSYSETKSGKEITTPWDFDSPDLNSTDFLKIYRYSTVSIEGGSAELRDSPGRTFELDPLKDITIRTGRDAAKQPVTVFVLNAGALQNNPQFNQDVQAKYSVDMKFQTYLVDPETYSPLGYFSWGVTITTKVTGPESTVAGLKWIDGSDSRVWRSLK